MDWNNDGRKDVITGESYDGGNVRIYLNQGTDSAPSFSTYANVKTGGVDFACGYYADSSYYGSQTQPFVTDWNNDGKKDLLVGNILGQIYLFINTGSDSAPLFAAAPALKTTGGGEINPGWRSSPAVVDWDGDGKKDLLAGNDSGYVKFYRNTGTDAAPSFDTTGGTSLTAGGATLAVAGYARLALADWNGDGIVDLLVGDANGNVRFFRRSIVDDDVDGMPDAWEVAHFQNTSAAPSADADGDGVTNLDEYLAGTLPREAASCLRLCTCATASDGSMLLAWHCVAGKRYNVFRSDWSGSDGWTLLTPTPLAGSDAGVVSHGGVWPVGRMSVFRIGVAP